MEEHTVKDTIIRDTFIVLAIALIIYISNNITSLNVDTVASGAAPEVLKAFIINNVNFEIIQNFLLSVKVPLTILALVLMAGWFWTVLKVHEIHHHEEEKMKPLEPEVVSGNEKSIQWQVILDHANSDNSAEWKLAILEADNILDEVLEDMGYVGETVAEKLKAMSRTKIASYDDVWEAHLLRNKIAHGGAIDMDLSKKMVRDTVAKFENAFKELGYL